jgi:hypothetical protein
VHDIISQHRHGYRVLRKMPQQDKGWWVSGGGNNLQRRERNEAELTSEIPDLCWKTHQTSKTNNQRLYLEETDEYFWNEFH